MSSFKQFAQFIGTAIRLVILKPIYWALKMFSLLILHLHEIVSFIIGLFIVLFFWLLFLYVLEALIDPIGLFQEILCYTILTLIYFYVLFLVFSNNDEKNTYGSARFASSNQIKKLTETGLLIGKSDSNKFIRYDGPGHLLTIAASRSGKGVGTVIPNLLTANRSVLCIDPKGENISMTYATRAKLGDVYFLDPFNVLESGTFAFNPLDSIDITGDDYVEDVQSLAEALVFESVDTDSHWNEEAKALLTGLVFQILFSQPESTRNLLTLREYCTLPSEQFSELLQNMQNSTEANGLIARCANRFLSKNDKEASSVLSTLQRHTHFLDSPRMANVLSRSDFEFKDLKKSIKTVFLVIPPERISAYNRWLRLLITQSLTEMARESAVPEKPVLYLLDEFAALGRLESVETAIGIMAGYHVQLWPILQDIHQLKNHYGQLSGSFFSNAAVLQIFGVNDFETAKLVSNLLGEQTCTYSTSSYSSTSQSFFNGSTTSGTSEHLTGRPLLMPDEVRNLPQHEQLIFISGMNPIRANKIRYFDDPDFQHYFEEKTQFVQ